MTSGAMLDYQTAQIVNEVPAHVREDHKIFSMADRMRYYARLRLCRGHSAPTNLERAYKNDLDVAAWGVVANATGGDMPDDTITRMWSAAFEAHLPD